MRTSAMILLLTIAALGSRPGTAADYVGGANCCDRCGRHVPCIEKCQVVCEIKKETKTFWTVEYQEFCTLMPGCHHGSGDCPPAPRSGHAKCVKKLMKNEYQVGVPVYKCVVRHLCADCCNGGSADVPNARDKPPAAFPTPAISPTPTLPQPPDLPPSRAKK